MTASSAPCTAANLPSRSVGPSSSARIDQTGSSVAPIAVCSSSDAPAPANLSDRDMPLQNEHKSKWFSSAESSSFSKEPFAASSLAIAKCTNLDTFVSTETSSGFAQALIVGGGKNERVYKFSQLNQWEGR